MKLKLLFLGAAFAACVAEVRAQLVINEIMQSNVDCYMVDNEFPDSWVELYNAGTSEEKLSDYKLGETNDASQACKLSSGNSNGGWDWPWGGWWPGGGGDTGKKLQPKERIVICCDKVENKDEHANFRLESGKGCTLYLFKNDKVVDQLPDTLKKQPSPNIAYGRKTDGGNEWGYLIYPTPNEANRGDVVDRKHILDDPIFSVPGRVFREGETFTVELSLEFDTIPGTRIRYTTDGSEPTSTSTIYKGPIEISSTTILRAKPFATGWLSPRSVTHSYIMMDRDVTLPVISIVTDKKHLYDNTTGIMVNNNASNKDIKWRRPINMEMFEETNLDESVINQICETRLSGNWTRRFPLRTMAVYAHKRFGTNHFKYELFPDQKPGIANFKSILLRNAGNDFSYTYMRDAVVQRQLAKHCDVDWQAWRPAIIFINGEYKGMLNIRERSNEDNMYSNYDKLEDIDFIENSGQEIKAGTRQNWDDFSNFFRSNHTYEQFDERMDVQEYINAMILEILHCNLDFPGNNYAMWRPREEGGRWRIQLKDIDYALGIYDRPTNQSEDIYKIDCNFNMLSWLYGEYSDPQGRYTWGNSSNATQLFRSMMNDKDIKREFIDRFAIYMGDFLSFDCMWNETWREMTEKIEYEYRYHRELYKQPWSDYEKELEKAKTWLQKRVDYVYNHLKGKYGLGTPVPLYVTFNAVTGMGDDATEVESTIVFNGVELCRPFFQGKFFANRDIKLECEGAIAWHIIEGDESKTVEGEVLEYKIPTGAKNVAIYIDHPNMGGTDIDRTFAADDNRPAEIYDANGVRRDRLTRGVNIIRQANGKVVKKIIK